MSEEENILRMVIEKQSWEEIIYHIISLEELDPWNVDLVKLTNRFIQFVRSAKELDFRIPAKIVFVAAILLKLKADFLSIFEEEPEEEIAEKSFIDLDIDPSLMQLGVPIKRIPKRQVTVDELISALRKALKVRERREERRHRWRALLNRELEIEEDIEKRIAAVFNEIEGMMQRLKSDKIEFRHIVEEWNRDQIVDHFVPLLHLEQNQRIATEQEEHFKPIWIKKR
jgi:segregation and condensation protein A